jgi:hypothetical protein
LKDFIISHNRPPHLMALALSGRSQREYPL